VWPEVVLLEFPVDWQFQCQMLLELCHG
jgi:hypothetical protein